MRGNYANISPGPRVPKNYLFSNIILELKNLWNYSNSNYYILQQDTCVYLLYIEEKKTERVYLI
jgi:hypothetical protein